MKSKRCKTEPQTEEPSFIALENGDNEAAECNDGAENGELQSPQAQTRWTPECTRVMLQLRFDRQIEFQQRIRQKKELWSEIATEMRRQGLCDFSLTAEVCDLKYRNMLQTYKKNRLKEDGGMQSLIAWEYYELFKEALTAAEELEAAQEGQERVVPSLLCESVCAVVNENEIWSAGNETDFKLMTVESAVNDSPERFDMEAEDIKSITNTKSAGISSRKRSRRSAMKTEAVSPPPEGEFTASVSSDHEATILVECSKQNSFTYATSNDTHPQLICAKPDTYARSQRRRTGSSFSATIPTIHVEPASVGMDVRTETTLTASQNDPITSSTSAVSIAIPSTMQASQPPQTAVPPLNHTPITIVHPNHLHAIPIGLAPSEMRECQVFGESIGLQLAHVSEPHMRAMVQFKIQELLYMAKTGKLVETGRV